MDPRTTDTGRYLTLEKQENRLLITLTEEGREYLQQQSERENPPCDTFLFGDLMEDHCGNGWTFVRPEQVGDLRDDAMHTITDDFTFEDTETDDRMIVGTAWVHTRYCFDLISEKLLEEGSMTFDRHDYLTAEEFDAALKVLDTCPNCGEERERGRPYCDGCSFLLPENGEPGRLIHVYQSIHEIGAEYFGTFQYFGVCPVEEVETVRETWQNVSQSAYRPGRYQVLMTPAHIGSQIRRTAEGVWQDSMGRRGW